MKLFNHSSLKQQPRQKFVDISQPASGRRQAITNCAKRALFSAMLGLLGLAAMNTPALAMDGINSCKSTAGVVTTCLYLSVREGSMTPGTDLIGWTDTSGAEQRWNQFLFLTDPVTTDDWYGTPEWNIARLRNLRSGLCITTDGIAGHPLTQQICDPQNPRQLWTWRQNDTHTGKGYKNPASNLWIDREGGSYNNGTRVIAWSDQGGAANQQWNSTIWSDGVSNSKYFVNDTDPYIHYTHIGVITQIWSNDSNTRSAGYKALSYATYNWGYSPGRPAAFNDMGNDVHYTMNDNEAVYYSFTGSGISYISETSEGYGLVDVYVDGVFQKTVDANAPGVRNKGLQVLFTVTGLPRIAHDIAIVKRSGVYMLLDGFEVYP